MRRIATYLAGVLLVSIVGCGQQTPTATPEPTAIPTPTATPDPTRYWQAQYEQAQGISPGSRAPLSQYKAEMFPEYAALHMVQQETLRQAAASAGTTPELTTFAEALPVLIAQAPDAETWRALRAMTLEQRWVMYERYADLGQSYLRGMADSVLAGREPTLTFQATDLALAGGAAAITQLMVQQAAFRSAQRGAPTWLSRGLTRLAFDPATIRAWEITPAAIAQEESYLDELARVWDHLP